MVAEDLPSLGYDFPVPFFVIQGTNDHITPTDLARDNFERIQAPRKVFLVIENTGYFAVMTKPIEFVQALDKRSNRWRLEQSVPPRHSSPDIFRPKVSCVVRRERCGNRKLSRNKALCVSNDSVC